MADVGTQGGASGPRAGFWRRFGGALIDGVILVIIDVILRAALKNAGAYIGIAIAIIYFTAFEGSARGQTPGKSALGIRVVGIDTGTSIGYGRAFIRFVGRYVSAIPIFLGYFWMLWDRENQCWHDKFASDVVVPVSAYPLP